MTNSNSTYIDTQLRKLNLVPQKYQDKLSHLTADFIEIQALFSADALSLNDILAKFYKESIKISNLSDKDGNKYSESEKKDNDEIWIKEQFQICAYRENLLDENYPFNLGLNSIQLKDDLSSNQEVYILLLLSSNLNYFPDFKPNLTKDFEAVSYEVLKNFLPANAITKQFGKNSDYTGSAKEKIRKLAADLKIRCNNEFIEETATGNQERGLDLIGWIPYKDGIPNLITLLGQCACGKEWYNKKGETKRYEKYYHFDKGTTPIHSMFIPYALVKSENSFYQADEIDNLLFERFRIIEYLDQLDFFDNLESKQIVTECIDFNII
ncbi:hypothetical protein [Marinifilum fragile]|uniref:hypothetical protein n=1 Tax=Marinifilum fragile TaxID=570161 RepID=UPI002AA87E4F|nr:hypothetical protein [Marinifilum fragile]